MESERQVDLMTPLSARTYLEAYYKLDESDDAAGLKPLLAKFEGKDIVATAALRGTWPDGEWQDGVPEGDQTTATIAADFEAANDTSKSLGHDDSMSTFNAPQSDRVKTLRDRSMDMVLDELLDPSGEISELVSSMEILPDFVPKLRQKFYEQAADLTLSATLLRLLLKALEDDIEVDLSPFKSFTAEHLAVLVAGLRNGKMKVLNLSNMPKLTETDLEMILVTGPAPSRQSMFASPSSSSSSGTAMTGGLEVIVLLETPQVPIEYLLNLQGTYEIHHSGLFRHALYCERQDSLDTRLIPALQFATPDIISQLVWVGVSSKHLCDAALRLHGNRFDWSELEYSSEASDCFRTQRTPKFQNFLLDIPLPVGKFVHGVWRLVSFITSPNLGWFEHWPKGAARCFSTTSPLINDGEYGVGALSSSLSREQDEVECAKGRQLREDQWALILIHEAFDARDQESLDKKCPPAENGQGSRPLKRLRYALAKPHSNVGPANDSFLVTNIPGYIEPLVGRKQGKAAEAEILIKWWNVKAADVGANFSYYEEDDIQDILHKIYKAPRCTDKPAGGQSGTDPVEALVKPMAQART